MGLVSMPSFSSSSRFCRYSLPRIASFACCFASVRSMRWRCCSPGEHGLRDLSACVEASHCDVTHCDDDDGENAHDVDVCQCERTFLSRVGKRTHAYLFVVAAELEALRVVSSILYSFPVTRSFTSISLRL